MEKMFKGTNGEYYSLWQINRSLEIVYGIKYRVNNAKDVEELINTGTLKGIEPGEHNPTVEELLRSGSKALAVRKYYNDYNEEHPDTRISLREAKFVVDHMENNMIIEDVKMERDLLNG